MMAGRFSPDLAALRYIRNWAPILMFHEVVQDDAPEVPPYGIRQSGLREILQDFLRRGYTPGTLEHALPNSKANKRLVLTFDDGTSDFVEHALPVLQDLGFSATLFIVAGKVGGKRDWAAIRGQAPLAPVPLLGADELRALHARGFTIGSHTCSHCWMSAGGVEGLPDGPSIEQLRREATHSRDVLSDMIGAPVCWFAYPYLAADRRAREIVREAGYRGACGGPNRPHERYYLNRVDATTFSIRELRRRCSGLFHIGRQLVRQARGVGVEPA
jgi:peptidoglycan/xylan/chitin deacetylase (PgdA/CDA1 family)